MIIEKKILKAIVKTMICNECPYPCEAKEKSSLSNCVLRWSYILQRIDVNTDWNEVRYEVADEFFADCGGGLSE